MNIVTVGIGGWAVSEDPDDLLKTYALGSCLAVLAYDRLRHIGGMIHLALPDSGKVRDQEHYPAAYFADSGISLLVRQMEDLGSCRRNWWIKLIGGAAMMDQTGIFDIGKRNILAAKRILWQHGLGPIAEDTGSDHSRTVSLQVSDGATTISSGSRHWQL